MCFYHATDTTMPIEVNYSMPRTIVAQGNSPKDGRLHQVGENYRLFVFKGG